MLNTAVHFLRNNAAGAAMLAALGLSSALSYGSESSVNQAASIVVTPAPELLFPGGPRGEQDAPKSSEVGKILADCNSPLEWAGDKLYVFNSWAEIWRGEGPDALHLHRGSEVQMDPALAHLRLWLESTHRDQKGVLYGWVHNEYPKVCPDRPRTMPSGHPLLARVAAVRSTDDGRSWENLGWVLPGRPDALKCDTEGTWYVGGFGDSSSFVDNERSYIYIFFASYARDFAEQGLAVARMPYSERDQPVGKLSIWNGRTWEKWPDEHGHVTPLLPAAVDIHKKDGKIFWGPSIHWNTYLHKYVMLVNQTKDAAWHSDGQYVLFADSLADPRGWSKPVKFMDWEQVHASQPSLANGWYVQIVGTGKGETDKLASQTARLFLDGRSFWQVRFRKPGDQ